MEADFKELFSRMIRSKSPPSMGSPSIRIIFRLTFFKDRSKIGGSVECDSRWILLQASYML